METSAVSISGVLNIASSGMRAQTNKVGVVAGNIANSSTPGYAALSANLQSTAGGGVAVMIAPSGQSGEVDITGQMTDLIQAEQSYKASAVVFETGADMWDMLMSIKRD